MHAHNPLDRPRPPCNPMERVPSPRLSAVGRCGIHHSESRADHPQGRFLGACGPAPRLLPLRPRASLGVRADVPARACDSREEGDPPHCSAIAPRRSSPTCSTRHTERRLRVSVISSSRSRTTPARGSKTCSTSRRATSGSPPPPPERGSSSSNVAGLLVGESRSRRHEVASGGHLAAVAGVSCGNCLSNTFYRLLLRSLQPSFRTQDVRGRKTL